MFWDDIRFKEVHGGRLFDGEDVMLISYNKGSDDWKYGEIIGKGLLWCWLHQGSLPKWLHPMHLQYVIEGKENIDCMDILSEYQRSIYNFVNDICLNLHDPENLITWFQNRNINEIEVLNINYY